MKDSIKKMCDSIKTSKDSFFSELEGAENINIDSFWTRRLVAPWGLLYPVEGKGEISLNESVVTASKGSLFVYTQSTLSRVSVVVLPFTDVRMVWVRGT